MKWPQKNLGDLAIVSSGDGAPQDASDFGNSGLPFVRAGSLSLLLEGRPESELELIPKAISSNRRMNIFPAKTVLFAKSGMSCTKGLVYQLKSPAHVVNHLAAIQCGNDLDSRFLLRWFEANSPARLIANEAYPSIKISDIRAEKIPLPPLPEQKRIAAILDKADSLRNKRRETIKQLDKLAQSLFIAMFGDPVTNPKGWEVSSGKHVAKRLTVGIVIKPASYYQVEGIPALRSLNIKPNKIHANSLVYVSASDNESRLKKTRVWKDDLVLVRSGQPGTAAIIPPAFDGVNAIDILILTPNQNIANSEYLCNFFNSEGGKRMVSGAERGQIQKHLNVSSLKAAPIPLPPIYLQQRFASLITSIQNHKTRRQTQLTELNTLFTSLQARAFKGEL